MKFFSVLLALVMAFSSACARPGPPAPPREWRFSALRFSGNALLDSSALPVQGALTRGDGALKFVVMAQTGVLLGHGWLEPGAGEARVAFSRSMAAKKLTLAIGRALETLLSLAPGLSARPPGPSDIPPPGEWTFERDKDGFAYHNARLSIFIPREGIQ